MDPFVPPYLAAYVPEDPPTDLELTAGAAMEWLRQGSSGPELVVSFNKDTADGLEALRGVTRASRRSPASGRFGRVLAYAPDEHVLADAARCAHGGRLVVVEGWTLQVRGWARLVRAVNLRDELPPPPFTPEQEALLDQLHWHGNNGYKGGREHFGRQRAESLVPRILEAGVEPMEVLGYLVARGQHGGRVEGLRRQMPEVFG